MLNILIICYNDTHNLKDKTDNHNVEHKIQVIDFSLSLIYLLC